VHGCKRTPQSDVTFLYGQRRSTSPKTEMPDAVCMPTRRSTCGFSAIDRGDPRRWVPLRNGGSPSTFGRTDVLEYQDASTSVHPFITSMRQALCLNTNATNIASVHHRHHRPPPAHTFTLRPPIHLADLSRPRGNRPTPASPSLNCSRHAAATLAPALRFGASAGVAHTSGQYCGPPIMLVFSRNPPWGQEPLHGGVSSTAVHNESSSGD